MIDLDGALRQTFPIISDWSEEHAALGFRAMPFSGKFARSMPLDVVLAKIKEALPSDAVIYSMDGLLYRMRGGISGYGSDTYSIVFGSSTWEALPEGSLCPELYPMFHEMPVKEDGEAYRIELNHFSPPASYEIVIDKRTQVFEIPRDRETEEQVVIVIQPA